MLMSLIASFNSFEALSLLVNYYKCLALMSLIYWLSVCLSYFYFFMSFLRLVFYVVSVSIVVLDSYCFFFNVV